MGREKQTDKQAEQGSSPQCSPCGPSLHAPTGYMGNDAPIPNAPVTASIRDFGAVGDGSTDDTDSVLLALYVMQSGVLYFPPGRWLLGKATCSLGNVEGTGEAGRCTWAGEEKTGRQAGATWGREGIWGARLLVSHTRLEIGVRVMLALKALRSCTGVIYSTAVPCTQALHHCINTPQHPRHTH